MYTWCGPIQDDSTSCGTKIDQFIDQNINPFFLGFITSFALVQFLVELCLKN